MTDDITMINVNFSLSPSSANQVDAVIGAYRNFELNQLEIEGVEPGFLHRRAWHPDL